MADIKEIQEIDFKIDFYREWIRRFKGDIKKLKECKKELLTPRTK